MPPDASNSPVLIDGVVGVSNAGSSGASIVRIALKRMIRVLSMSTRLRGCSNEDWRRTLSCSEDIEMVSKRADNSF